MSKSILNLVLMLATPPQHRIVPNGSPRIVAILIPRMQGTRPVRSVEESIIQPNSPVFQFFPDLLRVSCFEFDKLTVMNNRDSFFNPFHKHLRWGPF